MGLEKDILNCNEEFQQHFFSKSTHLNHSKQVTCPERQCLEMMTTKGIQHNLYVCVVMKVGQTDLQSWGFIFFSHIL